MDQDKNQSIGGRIDPFPLWETWDAERDDDRDQTEPSCSLKLEDKAP